MDLVWIHIHVYEAPIFFVHVAWILDIRETLSKVIRDTYNHTKQFHLRGKILVARYDLLLPLKEYAELVRLVEV